MSVTYISVELRRAAVERAKGLCEYCLIAEEDTYFGCEIDHVISEKHGGLTEADNLAHACVFCNQAKGSDVGSIFWETGEFVRFFNPRTDNWAEHYKLTDIRIEPLTKIATVTADLLKFNEFERLEERRILQEMGRYPNEAALAKMNKRDSQL